MKFRKILFNLILVILIPQICVCSVNSVQIITQEILSKDISESYINFDVFYDNILAKIEYLENVSNDTRINYLNENELIELTSLVIDLSRMGSLILDANEEDIRILENDIASIFIEKENSNFSYGDYRQIDEDLPYSFQYVNFTKSFKKNWKKVSQKIEKHKKEIIVASIAILAALVTVCIIRNSHSNQGEPSTVDHQDNNSSDVLFYEEVSEEKPFQNEVSSEIFNNEEVYQEKHLEKIIEKEITTIKTVINEEVPYDSEIFSSALKEPSFGRMFKELARNLGSTIVHEVLNEIAGAGAIIGTLQQEIIDFGKKILPYSLFNNEVNQELNWEDSIASDHKKIDEIFSTDQSYDYTNSLIKEIRDSYTKLVLPPPMVNKQIKEGEKVLNKFSATENIEKENYLSKLSSKFKVTTSFKNGKDVLDFVMPNGEYIGNMGSSINIRELEGGRKNAEIMFEKFSKNGNFIENSKITLINGKMVELEDGTRILYRPKSLSGPSTIDINIPKIPKNEYIKLKFLD